jgi:hypothetical protein
MRLALPFFPTLRDHEVARVARMLLGGKALKDPGRRICGGPGIKRLRQN